MNVYRVTTFAKPQGTKFQYYAQLSCKKADESFLSTEHFEGRPFPKKWRQVVLHFDEPLWPRADFYHLGLGNFVCNERVKTIIGPVMEKCGEFLPVSIEGENGIHYIYNVTNSVSCLDLVHSIWNCDVDDKDELEDPPSALLAEPAFDIRKVENKTIFKIPENSEIYCAEDSTGSSRKAFKALVEHHKLSGLRFELAWDGKIGPVPKHSPPAKASGFVWMTGDGKKYKGK